VPSDEQVLAFLGDALAGNLDQLRFEAFVAQMVRGANPLLDEAMHALGHYQIDHDIRVQDKAYERFCRETLLTYIERISSSNSG
jgi:hypothetical protein